MLQVAPNLIRNYKPSPVRFIQQPQSKHSARLHFEDRKCRFQFIYGLSNFGVFANFVLQSFSKRCAPATCSAACRAPESGLDSACVSMT